MVMRLGISDWWLRGSKASPFDPMSGSEALDISEKAAEVIAAGSRVRSSLCPKALAHLSQKRFELLRMRRSAGNDSTLLRTLLLPMNQSQILFEFREGECWAADKNMQSCKAFSEILDSTTGVIFMSELCLATMRQAMSPIKKQGERIPSHKLMTEVLMKVFLLSMEDSKVAKLKNSRHYAKLFFNFLLLGVHILTIDPDAKRSTLFEKWENIGEGIVNWDDVPLSSPDELFSNILCPDLGTKFVDGRLRESDEFGRILGFEGTAISDKDGLPIKSCKRGYDCEEVPLKCLPWEQIQYRLSSVLAQLWTPSKVTGTKSLWDKMKDYASVHLLEAPEYKTWIQVVAIMSHANLNPVRNTKFEDTWVKLSNNVIETKRVK